MRICRSDICGPGLLAPKWHNRNHCGNHNRFASHGEKVPEKCRHMIERQDEIIPQQVKVKWCRYLVLFCREATEFASSFLLLFSLISHLSRFTHRNSYQSFLSHQQYGATCQDIDMLRIDSFLRAIISCVSLDRGAIIDLIVSQCFRKAQSRESVWFSHSPHFSASVIFPLPRPTSFRSILRRRILLPGQTRPYRQ